jgi:hypothetical protein
MRVKDPPLRMKHGADPEDGGRISFRNFPSTGQYQFIARKAVIQFSGVFKIIENIVTCLLKARIGKPSETAIVG